VHDVDANTTVVGIPAKVVRRREPGASAPKKDGTERH
jgi:serine acetyltransferase